MTARREGCALERLDPVAHGAAVVVQVQQDAVFSIGRWAPGCGPLPGYVGAESIEASIRSRSAVLLQLQPRGERQVAATTLAGDDDAIRSMPRSPHGRDPTQARHAVVEPQQGREQLPVPTMPRRSCGSPPWRRRHRWRRCVSSRGTCRRSRTSRPCRHHGCSRRREAPPRIGPDHLQVDRIAVRIRNELRRPDRQARRGRRLLGVAHLLNRAEGLRPRPPQANSLPRGARARSATSSRGVWGISSSMRRRRGSRRSVVLAISGSSPIRPHGVDLRRDGCAPGIDPSAIGVRVSLPLGPEQAGARCRQEVLGVASLPELQATRCLR